MPERAIAIERDVPLATLSTLGVGGPARAFVRATTIDDVRAAHAWTIEHDQPLFVFAGGSNLVIADEGIHGLVLHVGIRGQTVERDGHDTVLRIGAGEPWDDVVARACALGLSGIECLSGIPGSTGGTPIQNVGAYGQDVASTIDSVMALDRQTHNLVRLAANECQFGYRVSRFKGEDAGRFIVCEVALRLRAGEPTVVYPDLAQQIAGRDRVTVGVVRDAVLAVRRRKGMVLDAADPDTRSVGSFFMNPIVSEDLHEQVARAAGTSAPRYPAGAGRVKVPAAWLIERAGFQRGHTQGVVGISSKHTLAIVNRGGATARDVLRLAVAIKRRVADCFGVSLRPEPVLVGFDGDADAEYLLT
jgi:UDP-N-acetylmuramate dehydrogenase